MTGVAGNAWTLAVGKQSAKGTPQTTPNMKLKYTGGFGPSPARNIINLAETDASRQLGDPVVVGYRVEGASEHYLRPDEAHRIADYLMGQTTTTGSTDYTHTSSSTASGSAPYATLYRALNTTALVERFADCQLVSAQFQGGAGQVLSVSLQWLGLSFLEGEADPVKAVSAQTPLVYPNVTVTKAGVATEIVDSFTINVTQNRTLIEGDTGLAAADITAGQFAVTGSFSILFESDADYRKFHTGSAVGTAPTTTIASETLVILAQVSSVLSVAWDMDAISTTSYAPPGNTDGGPIRVSVDFASRRGATLANVMEMITKNQIATVVA